MRQISIIGLDIAKNIFQLHGVTKSSQVLLRKRLRRAQMIPFFQTLSPCLIGIESCAGSHYWARTLTDMGHKVRLMDPRFVKPYVKGNKTDAIEVLIVFVKTNPAGHLQYVFNSRAVIASAD